MALIRQFTEAYGPLILVLGAGDPSGAPRRSCRLPRRILLCVCCRVSTLARLRSPMPSPTPTPTRAEDLHNFDAASFRLLSAAIGDEPLRRAVLFIVTFRCRCWRHVWLRGFKAWESGARAAV